MSLMHPLLSSLATHWLILSYRIGDSRPYLLDTYSNHGLTISILLRIHLVVQNFKFSMLYIHLDSPSKQRMQTYYQMYWLIKLWSFQILCFIVLTMPAPKLWQHILDFDQLSQSVLLTCATVPVWLVVCSSFDQHEIDQYFFFLSSNLQKEPPGAIPMNRPLIGHSYSRVLHNDPPLWSFEEYHEYNHQVSLYDHQVPG